VNKKSDNIQLSWLRSASNPRHLVTSYVLFSVYVILYLAFSLTIIKLHTYPFIHRITYIDYTANWTLTDSLQLDVVIASIIFSAAILCTFKKFIALPLSTVIMSSSTIILVASAFSINGIDYNQSVTNLFFLLSLPVLVVLLLANRIVHRMSYILPNDSRHFDFQKFLIIFFLTFAFLELFTLLRWLVHPALLDLSFEHVSWRLNILENNFFYSFGLFIWFVSASFDPVILALVLDKTLC